METYTVTWGKDESGRVHLFITDDHGEGGRIPCDEPIGPNTDSWQVAADVCQALDIDLDDCAVEHDREYIHITVLR